MPFQPSCRGGITLLGLLTGGTAGWLPAGSHWMKLNPHFGVPDTLMRGVWVILSLVIQILIDFTKLSRSMMWLARTSAPVAAVAVSGGFFGMAFFPGFRWLLYFGALSLVVSIVLTGVGLLRNIQMDQNKLPQPAECCTGSVKRENP